MPVSSEAIAQKSYAPWVTALTDSSFFPLGGTILGEKNTWVQIKARQAESENTCALALLSKPAQVQEQSKLLLQAVTKDFF